MTDQPSKPIIQTWLEHIRVLSEDIGPRGSTTKGERQGAIYCLSAFQRIGLKPVLETFFSARSIFGLKRDGEAPYWHQKADTFGKMDPVVMENTHTLTWAMIQRIDRGQ